MFILLDGQQAPLALFLLLSFYFLCISSVHLFILIKSQYGDPPPVSLKKKTNAYLYEWKLSELQTACPYSSATPLEVLLLFLASQAACACSENPFHSCEVLDPAKHHVVSLRCHGSYCANLQLCSCIKSRRELIWFLTIQQF
jgi:hypothetical protein